MKLTPIDWAEIKEKQAAEILGTPEAQELLADAKKFRYLAEELAYLERMLDERPV
jgi:hypothetical protein